MNTGHDLTAEIDEARAEVQKVRAAAASDPVTLSASLMQMAKKLKTANERVESEALFREALAIRWAALPPDDIRVGVAATCLGRFLEETDRLDEAEPLYREAVMIFRRSLPPGHPHLSLSLRNLAAVLDELKGEARLTEAGQLMREALQLSRADTQGDPQALAGSASDLGAHLTDRGELVEAEELLAGAMRQYRQNPNTRAQDLSYTLVRVARLRLAQNRFVEAEAAAREALTLRVKEHPATDHRVAKAKSLLGLCLVHLDRLDEAEELLTTALHVLETTPCAIAAGPSRIEDTRARLSMLRERRGG